MSVGLLIFIIVLCLVGVLISNKVLGLKFQLAEANIQIHNMEHKASKIADMVEGEAKCEGECSWVASEITLPSEDYPDVRDVCLECGYINGSTLALNEVALKRLNDSKEISDYHADLSERVAELLQFEMTGFFEEWLDNNDNKATLQKLLSTPLKESTTLDTLLFEFFSQATMASRILMDKLYKELEEEDLRG